MLIRGGRLADGDHRDVRVAGERITAVEPSLDHKDGEAVIEADGMRLLPGAIDVHVHFRQPGYPHKETWATGSQAAAAGGVTTVVDQPNTNPPTVSGSAFEEKVAYAEESLVDWGINGGVTPDWDPESLLREPLFALGEVFLADSTGEMGIDADLFADAVGLAADADVTVTVHAEDASLFDDSVRDRDDTDAWSAYRAAEAEAAAVERACAVGAESDARIHIAHTSTPEGIDEAAAAGATCEVTPHHLLLSREDLPELGTFGRMNPPLRSVERREAVYERVADGTVDMIATDHAPHTRGEKDAGIWEAPSGVPGVETMLPLLLAEAEAGQLGWERVRELVATNPATVFDLPRKGAIREGSDADLVLVDPDDRRPIRGDELHTKCGWTPFEGLDGIFPSLTLVRGNAVYDPDGLLIEEPFGSAVGQNVRR